MSKNDAPWGTIVGEIPLNAIGPPAMIVIVPIVNRDGSPFEVTTSVTVAVVGTAVGAEYSPFASIEPQVGLQVASCGKLIFPEGVAWVTNHVTPVDVPMSFVKEALNWNCESLDALELVGTVAVLGVKVTEMPESRFSCATAVFLVSAAAVAVMLTSKRQAPAACAPVQFVPGSFVASGTVCGAVYTTVVFVEFAGILPV